HLKTEANRAQITHSSQKIGCIHDCHVSAVPLAMIYLEQSNRWAKGLHPFGRGPLPKPFSTTMHLSVHEQLCFCQAFWVTSLMAKVIDVSEWLIEAGEDLASTDSFFGGSMPCARNEHRPALFLCPGTPIIDRRIERHEPCFRLRDERREMT